MRESDSLEPTLDLLCEELISYSEAAKELPTKPHISAIYRWANQGIGGIRLQTIRIGGKYFTTRQALTRFLEATQKN